MRPTIRAHGSELWASWNPYNVPLGAGLPFFGSTAPNSSFVFPYGQAISRTVYASMFSVVGTAYGSGDGSTTFNIPDLRGRVVAGKDDMGGSAQNRLTSSWFGANAATLGATGGSEKSALSSVTQLPQVTPTVASYGLILPLQGFAQTGAVVGDHVSEGANNAIATTLPVGGSITMNSFGSATPSSFTTCQPTIIGNYILRVI